MDTYDGGEEKEKEKESGAALRAMAALGGRRRGLVVGSTGAAMQDGSHSITDETDGRAWQGFSRKRRRKWRSGGGSDSEEDEKSRPASGAGIAGGVKGGGNAMIERAERRWAEMAIQRETKRQREKEREREGNQREPHAADGDLVQGGGRARGGRGGKRSQSGGGKGRKGRKGQR